MRLQKRLADVVDDVVLLLRDHPRLRGHQPEAVRQCLVHPQRIGAVLELPLGELQRRRQRSRLVLRSVAVDAEPVVDRLAPLKRLNVEVAEHSRVIDLLFVLGQHEREQRRRRLKLPGSFRAPFGDLDQIARQIQKLLPVGEHIHLPGRHDRRLGDQPLLDLRLGERHDFTQPTRIAQHQLVGGLLDEQPDHGLAINQLHNDRVEPLAQNLGRIEHRFEERFGGGVRLGPRQIRPQQRRPGSLPDRMTFRTRQKRLMKDDRPALRIPLAPRGRHQSRGSFRQQLLVKRRLPATLVRDSQRQHQTAHHAAQQHQDPLQRPSASPRAKQPRQGIESPRCCRVRACSGVDPTPVDPLGDHQLDRQR